MSFGSTGSAPNTWTVKTAKVFTQIKSVKSAKGGKAKAAAKATKARKPASSEYSLLEMGVRIKDHKEGDGPLLVENKKVRERKWRRFTVCGSPLVMACLWCCQARIAYVGTLATPGRPVFDEGTLSFKLGELKKKVIPGLSIGCRGARVSFAATAAITAFLLPCSTLRLCDWCRLGAGGAS